MPYAFVAEAPLSSCPLVLVWLDPTVLFHLEFTSVAGVSFIPSFLENFMFSILLVIYH